MLDFDLSYFEEETRDGFTIPAFMKHAWASELEMLAKVDMICKENDITYFADWGTLLGTVRHKGYIPCDDDIDLCMKRHDLEKFCEVVDNYDGIMVRTCFNASDHGFHAARVMNSTMFTVERDTYKEYHGFPFPVGLDIFNLDYVPRDKKLEEEQVEAMRVCSSAFNAKEWLGEHTPSDKEYVQQLAEYKGAVKWLEKNCGIQFSEENPSEQEIVILNEEIAGLYGCEEADYLTEMPCLGNGRDYYIPKNYYEEVIYMPFENTTIPVPKEYDFILRKKYGDDYMTPKNVSSSHEYPFYNAFIRAIFDEKRHKTFEGACEYIENISSKFYLNFLTKSNNPRLDVHDNSIKEAGIKGKILTDSEQKKLLAECEVLEEFKRLCSVIDRPYFAVGNAIKAINTGDVSDIIENGLDVAIKREDLNEFIIKLGQELDPWFNYACLYSNENHEDMRINIWSDYYMCDKEDYKKRFHGCDDEVLLRISVIDKVSSDLSRDEVRKMLVENLITTARSMPNHAPYSDEVLGIVEEWKKIAEINVNTEVNLRREFLRAADNVAGAVAEDDVSKVRVSADLQDGVDTIYNRSDFDECIEVPFFATAISAPINYKSM
ncbi:MAG: LicD family protein [Lachnospiraceae bacterium]|nr:LicD family protein [Lachnospiraceae bacterium]